MKSRQVKPVETAGLPKISSVEVNAEVFALKSYDYAHICYIIFW